MAQGKIQQEVLGQLHRTKAGDGVLLLLRDRRAELERLWTQCGTTAKLRIQQGRAAELEHLIKLFDPSPKRQGE